MEYDFEDYDEFIEQVTSLDPPPTRRSFAERGHGQDDDHEEHGEGRRRSSAKSEAKSRRRSSAAADERKVELREWTIPSDLEVDIYGRQINKKRKFSSITSPEGAAAAEDGETKTESKQESAPETKTEIESETKPKIESETKPQNESQAKPEIQTKPETYPKPEIQPKQETTPYFAKPVRHSVVNDQIKSHVQIVQQLESRLETAPAKKAAAAPEVKVEHELSSYAETLHKGLRFLWAPMIYLGRLPFRLVLKDNIAVIHVRRRSMAYIACTITCVLAWILFVWITLGIVVLIKSNIKHKSMSKSDLSKIPIPNLLSPCIAATFWVDTFIFWTTLLQACISTTQILSGADELAYFIKEWYRVLDTSKIEVSKTLKKYIIINEIVLAVFILSFILMFMFVEVFPHVQATCGVIVICLAQPFIIMHEDVGYDDNYLQEANKNPPYFENLAFIGLLIYIMAMLFSWFYLVQFMVFCRCFRKGLKCLNNRLAMILNVDDVQRVGPNAVRLTYEFIHKDYLGIATTGAKIGRIYSWTMCNYYLWAILVLVFELGEIFNFAKRDYRRRPSAALNTNTSAALDKPWVYLCGANLGATQVISNCLIHLLITTFCIFYVSHEASGAHREGKISYELARYRGLIDCTTQLERNFIRSIWIIISEKCSIQVAPGKFFGITNSTVMTLFATAFTYFIFWAQSQTQLGAL